MNRVKIVVCVSLVSGIKAMENSEKVIITVSEFLVGALPSDSFEQVAQEIAEEQKDRLRVDPNSRRDEEWGLLANQVVGQENLPFIK